MGGCEGLQGVKLLGLYHVLVTGDLRE